MNRIEMLSYLSSFYNEPHRHYHNLNHINHLLGEYEQYTKDTDNFFNYEKIIDAIWWHDAIYNPYSSKNELNSENLYKLTLSPDYSEAVAEMICRTAKHTEDQFCIGESSKIMLDLDLSSLGADREIFFKNGENIRKEYFFVPEKVFLQNRIAFLQKLLGRSYIYYTDYFKDKYEAKARYNIAAEIAKWQASLNTLDQ